MSGETFKLNDSTNDRSLDGIVIYQSDIRSFAMESLKGNAWP
jgi:hypothetical protein